MGGASSPVLIVSSQEYVATSRATSIAPEWVSAGLASDGWTATANDGGEIAIEFVDGRARAAGGWDYPEIEGIPGAEALPVAASVRVPVQLLRFRRDSARCSAEVTMISAPLARAWASQVAALDVRPLADGSMGRADETNVTVTTDEVLIRLDLWEEGQQAADSRKNASRLQGVAGGILDALVAAHGS